MKKIIVFLIFAVSVLSLSVSCTDDKVTDAKSALIEKIREAENLLSTSVEGTEEGNIAPGSKDVLQTRIDQAYFIMDNTDRDEGYTNACGLLDDAIAAFQANIVKAGIPHFGLGSKMNLGPAADWNLDEAFTFEMRVRFSEFVSGDQNVISCEGGSGGGMIRNNGNQLQFYINNGGWCGGTVFTMELDTWYHIAATYQADGNMCFYVDGKLVREVKGCGTMVSPTVDLQLGTAPSYTDRYMRGDIQDVSIWDDVRTADEVKSDVACGFTGEEEGLMAYWPLNLNVGTEITDVTGEHVASMTEVTWLDE